MEADKKIEDHEAIKRTIQHYIDGGISGRGEDMKPAFHEGATIFGYVGDALFAGPIQGRFVWNDQRFKSLSHVARTITGYNVSGFKFFGVST